VVDGSKIELRMLLLRLMNFFGGVIQWNMIFVRASQDWEVDAFALFFTILNLIIMRREGEDKFFFFDK
jgi:hypothetical protein